MPERITDRMVMMKVARMQARGLDVGLDGQYGRFRVTNRTGSRDLSPRGPNREIADWLAAYEEGYRAGVERGISDMRHGRVDLEPGSEAGIGGNCENV